MWHNFSVITVTKYIFILPIIQNHPNSWIDSNKGIKKNSNLIFFPLKSKPQIKFYHNTIVSMIAINIYFHQAQNQLIHKLESNQKLKEISSKRKRWALRDQSFFRFICYSEVGLTVLVIHQFSINPIRPRYCNHSFEHEIRPETRRTRCWAW